MTAVRDALNDYRYAILHLSPKTQQEYLSKLLVFAAWCEGEHLALEDLKQASIRRFTEALRGRPIEAVTIHGYLRVLKRFLHWLSREEDYEAVVSSKLPSRIDMPKLEQKVTEIFTPEQIKALLAACGQEYNQELRVRDRAIVSVLIDTGIRASELTGLTLDNTFLDPLDAHLKVFGKGGKWREVALGHRSLVELRRYITRYRHASKEEGRVFLNRYDAPLTVWGLDQLIERLGKWAGVEGVRCSPHTFRHTFAVNYLQATGDVYRLSRIMGHNSVKVTEIYVRAVSNRTARKGMSVLDNMM